MEPPWYFYEIPWHLAKAARNAHEMPRRPWHRHDGRSHGATRVFHSSLCHMPVAMPLSARLIAVLKYQNTSAARRTSSSKHIFASHVGYFAFVRFYECQPVTFLLFLRFVFGLLFRTRPCVRLRAFFMLVRVTCTPAILRQGWCHIF